MNSIAEADLRAIVRLLGEAASVRGDFLEKKRHVLDGVCDLTGSVEWCWVILDRPPAEPGAKVRHGVRRTLSPRVLLDEGPDAPALAGTLVPRAKTTDRLVSHRDIGCGEHSAIVLIRPGGAPAYTKREKVLSRLILDGVSWLHFRTSPEGSTAKPLPPRLKHVLDLLLMGLSRKEIADRLGVALGTVNGYARELYAACGVNSQASLMRLHRHGVSARD